MITFAEKYKNKVMDADKLKELIEVGETSTVQFKEKLPEKSDISEEMVAMSNSKGGLIIIGVNDKSGAITGLSRDELQRIGNTVSTLASDAIKPMIIISTEVVNVEEADGRKHVLIISVPEGTAKPYKTTKGAIWVKQGADKRCLVDNAEQLRLFQESGLVFVDEMKIPGTSIADIDKDKVVEYVEKITGDTMVEEINETLYRNLNILKDDSLTLGGLLFFAKNPQRYRPVFCIKAVSFVGNDIGGTAYKDSEDLTGTIPEMFNKAMAFMERNLRHVQRGQDFNSEGILEISKIALKELIQNSLTHRDYTKNSPIRLLIFDNRVEIISPGTLPNNQTVESIKLGSAVQRNNLISSFCSKIMDYRGLGSGIIRAYKAQKNIQLTNDKVRDSFIAVIPRTE